MKLDVETKKENLSSEHVYSAQNNKFKTLKDDFVNEEKVKSNEEKHLVRDDDGQDNGSEYFYFSDEETIIEDAVDDASSDEKFQEVITDSNYDEFYDANDYSTTITKYEKSLLPKENSFNIKAFEHPVSYLAKADSNNVNKTDAQQENYSSKKQGGITKVLFDEQRTTSFSEESILTLNETYGEQQMAYIPKEEKDIYEKVLDGRQTTYLPKEKHNFFNMTSYEEQINYKTKIDDNLLVNLTDNIELHSNFSNINEEKSVNGSNVMLCYLFACLLFLGFILGIGYLYKTLKNRISSNEKTDRYSLLLRQSK